MSTITIYARGPDTYTVQGTVYSVGSDTTVGDLMSDIQDQKNFPIDKQLLWQGDTKLTDRDARLPAVASLYLQDLDYYRIFFYRANSSTKEEKYVKGTDILSAFMASIGQTSTQTTHYTVTLNGVLISADKYSATLAANNIVEDCIIRCNVDSVNG